MNPPTPIRPCARVHPSPHTNHHPVHHISPSRHHTHMCPIYPSHRTGHSSTAGPHLRNRAPPTGCSIIATAPLARHFFLFAARSRRAWGPPRRSISWPRPPVRCRPTTHPSTVHPPIHQSIHPAPPVCSRLTPICQPPLANLSTSASCSPERAPVVCCLLAVACWPPMVGTFFLPLPRPSTTTTCGPFPAASCLVLSSIRLPAASDLPAARVSCCLATPRPASEECCLPPPQHELSLLLSSCVFPNTW
jgi:hypothetical protein